MDDVQVRDLMHGTAASLRSSLDIYWPSDVAFRNDPSERNLSLHYAHTLLSRGFAVFAEAHYPAACQDATFLDILAIAPGGDFFVVGEFKKHAKGAGMTASAWDVDRLLKFDLHRGLAEPRWSKQRAAISANCKRGIGIVAGLKWAAAGRIPQFDRGASKAFSARLALLGGIIGEPLLVRESPGNGAYYLQYAAFPIAPPNAI